MTLLKHEIRQGKVTWILWTAIIAFMMSLCVFIYPDMKTQMQDISGMFSQMGGFSAAFGMDRLDFGAFMGFFGVECGNILGLGGAFFAALLGVSSLAKEEKEHTAEFLLTHPVSRRRIVLEKLVAVFLQILMLNLVVAAITLLSVLIIKESPQWDTLLLLFFAYFLLQLEIAAVCFGISAFLRGSGMGIGLGVAAVFYFLNILANLTEQARFLKYVTPFGYTESADILADGTLHMGYLSVGLLFLTAGIGAAFYRYCKKDIA